MTNMEDLYTKNYKTLEKKIKTHINEEMFHVLVNELESLCWFIQSMSSLCPCPAFWYTR
jgi:hypothetical protein